MKARIESRATEISVVCLGAVGATVEALVAHRTDISLIIGLTPFFLALAMTDIKYEVRREIRRNRTDYELVARVPNKRWRRDAEDQVEHVRAQIVEWATGTRRIRPGSSLPYQIALVGSAERSIRAVHVGLDSDAIEMWNSPQRGLARLVTAYRDLPSRILRQRLLVLSEEDDEISRLVGGRRVIVSEGVLRLCDMQVLGKDEGGLDFDLRIAWRRDSSRDITDMVIVDSREFCSIQRLGRDRFADLQACVQPVEVTREVRRFEDEWINATAYLDCREE